ncbi:MAG: hypothetical protein N2Z62_07895 [Rhodobacteraceae bacterium]|nr:hypothetical protein [Paracoccaceae bacterium]
MTHRERFSEADWAGVIAAPMVASFAVTAGDPGGLVGAVQEALATARALGQARREAAEGSLVAEVIAAWGDADSRTRLREGIRELARGRTPAEATAAAVARLGEIARSVEAAAPDEAAAFKAWLRDIAQKVAEAGTEGGFLGFGGEKVSEAERRTLAEIDSALAGPGA